MGTNAFYRSVRSKLVTIAVYLIDEHVQNLGVRIFPDFHHRQFIVLAKSRAVDSRLGAHFVLLK